MAATRSEIRSWLLRVAAMALGAQLLCAPAEAQRIVANPEYDAMFAQVLREPANSDLSFRFAEVRDRGRRLRGGDRRARAHAFLQPGPAAGQARSSASSISASAPTRWRAATLRARSPAPTRRRR